MKDYIVKLKRVYKIKVFADSKEDAERACKEDVGEGNITRDGSVVIGRSDMVINEAIAKAVKDSNLKIYILNPQDPENFLYKTLGINQWASDAIWGAVDGYYQITPKEMFARNPSRTSVDKDLFNNFFE